MPIVTHAPVTALIYTDSIASARTLERAAVALVDAGVTCAGFVQRDTPRPGRCRCDMSLVNLATGTVLPISEDRGPGARGCQLDVDALASCVGEALAGLDDDEISILVLNKFGKTESQGGGFRPLLVAALDRGIPVLLGVPWGSVDAWRAFAGEFALEVRAEAVGDAAGARLLELLGIGCDSLASVMRRSAEPLSAAPNSAVVVAD